MCDLHISVESGLQSRKKCANNPFMKSLSSGLLSRILRPIVRLMISRGFGFAAASELLKRLYVEEAEAHFQLDGKRMTESRISLLTGLRRREVKRLLEEGAENDSALPMGPAPRVLMRWATSKAWQDKSGAPLTLALRGREGESFEALAAEISKDIHARSVLDALEAAGSVSVDRKQGRVTLVSDTYLPTDDDAQLAYASANVGDHASAAVGNILSADAPFFERAAHFNNLTGASVAKLNVTAREVHSQALARIAAEAEAAQQRDADAPDANMRFRSGAYIFSESEARRKPK